MSNPNADDGRENQLCPRNFYDRYMETLIHILSNARQRSATVLSIGFSLSILLAIEEFCFCASSSRICSGGSDVSTILTFHLPRGNPRISTSSEQRWWTRCRRKLAPKKGLLTFSRCSSTELFSLHSRVLIPTVTSSHDTFRNRHSLT